jgi:sporulation protein YlmC with PRC-barrel domain
MHTIRVSFGIAFLLIGAVIVMPGAAAPDVSPPLYKTSAIIGRAVENPHGNELGQISDVMIEATTGNVAYAVLTSGGFVGLGGKLFAIPWRALQQPTSTKAFRLDMTEEQLKQAPGFDKDQWPDLEDRHWGDTVHAYYGQPPYWGQQLPPKTSREAEEQVPQRLLKASHVLKSEVMTPDGQWLGDIEEVVIDTAVGKVAYAVLSAREKWLGLGEKWFAIPWHTLQQSAGLGTFTLDVDKETLQKAPGFDKDNWPNRATTRWAG